MIGATLPQRTSHKASTLMVVEEFDPVTNTRTGLIG